MVVSRRATQAPPPYRDFPVEHCRAGSACPTAFNRGTSSNLRRGRCPHRPADRRKRSYILHRQRQRRRSRDDTKFRTRPTETLFADREGSQETIRFLAHLWVLSVRTESTPPEAWTRRFHRQPQLKHRNPISDRRRKPSRRAEDPGGGSFHAKTAKNSTRRAAGCRAPCALEGMERKIAN